MPLSTKILKKLEIKGSCRYEAALASLVPGIKKTNFCQKETLKETASEKVRAIQEEAWEKAREIQAAAEKILQEAEKIHQEAQLQGEKKGYAEGAARFASERAHLLTELKKKQRQASEELFLVRQRFQEKLWEAEGQLVELSTRIAETLLNEQLNLDPEKVASIVREAIAHLTDNTTPQKVKLYLHPADKPYCRSYLPALQKELLSGASIDLLSDEAISRGSCRLETEEGQVELLIDEELEHLRNALRTKAEREKNADKFFHQSKKI